MPNCWQGTAPGDTVICIACVMQVAFYSRPAVLSSTFTVGLIPQVTVKFLFDASIGVNIDPMLGRTYDKEVCSAARALELVGERWSLLILRNAAFAGMTRFTDFQKSLDIAPNILAARLERFVESGLMTTSSGSEGYQRYHLTKKGLDFKAVIIALTEWGDCWAAPDGPPIVYEHTGCGGRVKQMLVCKTCEENLEPQDITARKTPVMANLKGRQRTRASRIKS